MIFEETATGATLSEAIEAAKAKLNAPMDADVHTEIIEMPKKKVLGLFGGSPAKVKVSYEAPDATKPKPAPQPKKGGAPAPKPQPKKAPAPKPARVKAEVKLEQEEPEKREQVELSSSPVLAGAAEYVKTIVSAMGVEKCDITAFRAEGNEIILELDCGDDYGILIGKWGDTLDAIQYLTRLSANRAKDSSSDFPRISINVGNYRQKRSQYLEEYATKKAAGVRKFGRNVTLDPMNPYERRIIHTVIQGIDGVTSFSVGSEGERKVVIALEDGVKPLKPQRNGGRGGRNDRRGGGRPSQKVEAPARAPKTDEGAKSVGLYGKLN